MEKAPKIGDRVKFKGSCVVSPCVGVIEKIWPKRICLVDDDDPRWDDQDFLPAYGGPKPESEWQVTFKPDVIPAAWPYKKPDGTLANDKFCPSVSDLEPV